jgi:hypothetical protein
VVVGAVRLVCSSVPPKLPFVAPRQAHKRVAEGVRYLADLRRADEISAEDYLDSVLAADLTLTAADLIHKCCRLSRRWSRERLRFQPMRLLTRPSTRSPHGPQPRQPVIDRPLPFGWGLNPPSLPSGRLRSRCERSKVPIADEDHGMGFRRGAAPGAGMADRTCGLCGGDLGRPGESGR